jgi:hypothetical protein
MNQPGEIRAERARLIARAGVERERVVAQLRSWETPLALADEGVAAARCVRRHPEWVLGAAIVLGALRPRRAVAWARNGLIAWRVFRSVAAWSRGRRRAATSP